MSPLELIARIFLLMGTALFLIGTLGIIRFPDIYTRLHALAKVDNLGLGFTMLGILLQAPSLAMALKLLLIWLLVLLASGTVGFLIARQANRHKVAVWPNREDRP